MDMNEWAKNEIELAKKQEEKNAPDDCNYGNACYDMIVHIKHLNLY